MACLVWVSFETRGSVTVILLCWVVQVELLTPLNFTRHRLSPVAGFTSGAYFLHNGRWWQWMHEFYSANFKGLFEGLSCYRMPKPYFFSTHSLSSGQPETTQRHFFPILHPLSSVMFANAAVVAFIPLRSSRVQLPLLYTAWANAYSEIGPEVAAATFCDFLRVQCGLRHGQNTG